MIESQDRTINQHTYTLRQMPATAAHQLLTKLIKLVGPTVKGVIGASGQIDILAGVLSAFAERLDEQEVTKLLNQIMGYIEVQLPGQGVMPLNKVFETHFHGGNLSEMFKVVGAFLEVNYSDFFGGEAGDLKGLAASILASVRPSKSPTTSPGTSGV